jgi:hypothetical protein
MPPQRLMRMGRRHSPMGARRRAMGPRDGVWPPSDSHPGRRSPRHRCAPLMSTRRSPVGAHNGWPPPSRWAPAMGAHR